MDIPDAWAEYRASRILFRCAAVSVMGWGRGILPKKFVLV
jgi:hypothetical protein